MDQNQRGAYSLVSGCKVMVHPSSVFRRPLQPKPLHSTGSFKAQLDVSLYMKLLVLFCNFIVLKLIYNFYSFNLQLIFLISNTHFLVMI